jgi:hypothetical protein
METITKTGPGLFTRTVYDYLKELGLGLEIHQKGGDAGGDGSTKGASFVTTDAVAGSHAAIADTDTDTDTVTAVVTDAGVAQDASITIGDDNKGATLTSERQSNTIPGPVLVLPYWCFHPVPNDVSVDLLDNAHLEDIKAKYVQLEGPLFIDECCPQDKGANTDVAPADAAIQLSETHKENDERMRTQRPSVVHTEPPGKPYAIHWWQRSWQQKT